MPEELVTTALQRAFLAQPPAPNLLVHAESFWSRFKAELLDGGSFPDLAKAKLGISHHVAYYNTERRHSVIGCLAPNHFETQLKTKSQLCPA